MEVHLRQFQLRPHQESDLSDELGALEPVFPVRALHRMLQLLANARFICS